MKNRNGFALLAALWLTVALAAVLAGVLAVTRDGLSATGNRALARRGYWAAEACRAVLDARYASDPAIRSLDTVELGHGVWCTARLTEPAARVNVNRASADQLRLVLGADSLVEAFLDWTDADTVAQPHGGESSWYLQHDRPAPTNQPLEDPAELGLIRGFDAAVLARVLPLVTTVGNGSIDVNNAPVEVIATLPGMGPEALSAIHSMQATGKMTAIDGLAAHLSLTGRLALSAHWSTLQSMITYAPELFQAEFTGGVRSGAPTTTVREELVPDGRRLAVIQREVP